MYTLGFMMHVSLVVLKIQLINEMHFCYPNQSSRNESIQTKFEKCIKYSNKYSNNMTDITTYNCPAFHLHKVELFSTLGCSESLSTLPLFHYQSHTNPHEYVAQLS